MAIEVEGPDGGVIEFPDGTPDATIKSVMAKTYGRQQVNSADATIPTQQPQANRSFAQPMIAPAARGVTPGQDAIDSFQSGLVRGGIGLAMLPGNIETLGRMGVNYAGKKLGASGDVVSPEPMLPNSKHAEQMLADIRGKDLYQPQTTAGQYARTVGEFAPNMIFPGSVAQRVLGNTIAPAVASETAGQATEGTSFEPYARLAGALVGSRGVTPNPIGDPVRAQAVQTLNKEGVNAISAGQTTGNMPLRWTEQALADLPFVGAAQRMNEKAGDQFTKAALKRVGVDANRATPDVLRAVDDRVGTVYQTVAQQGAVPVSQRLVNDVEMVAQRYARQSAPALTNGLPAALASDVKALLNPRAPSYMTGAQYLEWSTQIKAAARGTKDQATKSALYDLQSKLDDGMERFLRQRGAADLTKEFKKARNDYRNLIVIENAVSSGEKGALGIITPNALETATRQMQGVKQYTEGKGDFTKLARAGSAILRPLPNSGTAQRSAVASGLAAVGSIAGGGPIGALSGVAVPAVIGRALMSKPVQTYLKNQTAPALASRNPASVGSAAQILSQGIFD